LIPVKAFATDLPTRTFQSFFTLSCSLFSPKGADNNIVLVTALLWQHHHKIEPWKFLSMKSCNALQFGEGNKNWNNNDRLSFDTFYVGKACSPVPFQENTHDFAMIASLRYGKERSKWDKRTFQASLDDILRDKQEIGRKTNIFL
jgi:hypothetical protein